jgi:hypothetical protein
MKWKVVAESQRDDEKEEEDDESGIGFRGDN